jgi:ABC-type sugar transport system ATPase subunit
MNVLEAKKTGSVLEATGVGSVDLGDAAPDAVADGDVTIGFRPETVELTEPQSSELTAEAQVVESTGSSRIVYLESGQGELRVETDRPIAQIEEMETYGLSIDPAAVHYFDAETGDRIEVDRARTSPAME